MQGSVIFVLIYYSVLVLVLEIFLVFILVLIFHFCLVWFKLVFSIFSFSQFLSFRINSFFSVQL